MDVNVTDPNKSYIEHFGEEGIPLSSPALLTFQKEHPPLLHHMKLLADRMQHFVLSSNVTRDEWLELTVSFQSFNNALDKHSEREERLLFPLLKSRIGTEHGPIEIMETEHEEIRRNLHAFAQNTGASRSILRPDELPKLSELLNQAYAVMQMHFFKEDQAIFPMAEELLTAEEMQRIEADLNLLPDL